MSQKSHLAFLGFFVHGIEGHMVTKNERSLGNLVLSVQKAMNNYDWHELERESQNLILDSKEESSRRNESLDSIFGKAGVEKRYGI